MYVEYMYVLCMCYILYMYQCQYVNHMLYDVGHLHLI